MALPLREEKKVIESAAKQTLFSPFHGPVVAQLHNAVPAVDKDVGDRLREVSGDGTDGLDGGDCLRKEGQREREREREFEGREGERERKRWWR